MDKFTEQLKKNRARVAMSPEEKRQMRAELVMFMKEHPIRAHRVFWRVVAMRSMASSLAIIALFAVVGGTAFASQSSLPGDTLYPIKILSEDVRGVVLASTPQKKVAWESERAERRLQEAVDLAAQGRLTAEISKEVTQRFDEQAQTLTQSIKTIESGNNNDLALAADAASQFEVALDAHREVLSSIAEDESKKNDTVQVKNLRASLGGQVANARKVRAETEDKMLAMSGSNDVIRNATQQRLAVAADAIQEARTLIGPQKPSNEQSGNNDAASGDNTGSPALPEVSTPAPAPAPMSAATLAPPQSTGPATSKSVAGTGSTSAPAPVQTPAPTTAGRGRANIRTRNLTLEDQLQAAAQLSDQSNRELSQGDFAGAIRSANEAARNASIARELIQAQRAYNLPSVVIDEQDDQDQNDPGQSSVVVPSQTSSTRATSTAPSVPLPTGSSDRTEIRNFEDCIRAGFPVLQTFPRMCRLPNGHTFTENIEHSGTEGRD